MATTKIHYVDDETHANALITQLFRQQIRDELYESVFALNRIKALRQLDKHADISLILSNVNMPEMDGLELLTQLQARKNPYLKSVMLSAYHDLDSVSKALRRVAYDIVHKPIDSD